MQYSDCIKSKGDFPTENRTMVRFNQYNFRIKTRGYSLAATLDCKKLDLGTQDTKKDLKEWVNTKHTAVLVHGLLSSKACTTLLTLSECLLDTIPFLDCVVRFDFHGNGDSSGVEDWSYGGYDDETQDLRAVIEALRDAGAQVTMILGHSRGSTVVLLYGCLYGDVPYIISVAGRMNMSKFTPTFLSPNQLNALKEGETIHFTDSKGVKRRVTQECLSRRHKADAIQHLEALHKNGALHHKSWKHLIILHCINDVTVPYEDSSLLYETAQRILPHVSLKLFNSGGHGFQKSEIWTPLTHYFQQLFPNPTPYDF